MGKNRNENKRKPTQREGGGDHAIRTEGGRHAGIIEGGHQERPARRRDHANQNTAKPLDRRAEEGDHAIRTEGGRHASITEKTQGILGRKKSKAEEGEDAFRKEEKSLFEKGR